MRRAIVGTAGHIDHGKTSLVLALTGIDCDRWAEEKARGITIDLGFAHLTRGRPPDRLRRRARATSGSSTTPSPASAASASCCWWWRPTRGSSRRRASTWRSARCSASRPGWSR